MAVDCRWLHHRRVWRHRGGIGELLQSYKIRWMEKDIMARHDAAVVGLSARKDHRPSELSGGEQQRVAIARALVSDPPIVVADEPTGDLDARSAHETLSLLRQLRAEFDKTIVMVTHDTRAEEYVDDVLHLDKGLLLGAAGATDAPQSSAERKEPAEQEEPAELREVRAS